MCRPLMVVLCLLFGVSPVFAYPKGDFEGREISENVESLLVARNYDALEKLAADYRKSNKKIKGGNSALYHFYPGLTDFGSSEIFSSKVTAEQKRSLLEEWLRRFPKSTTAQIAIAGFWNYRGWNTRGEEVAGNVSPQQWESFRKDLAISKKYISNVDPTVDPYVYLLLAKIAKGLSVPRVEMDAIFNRSIKAFPDFFHYYSERGVSLLGRWFGEPGEITNFGASVLISPGGEDGAIAYTYVTQQLLVHDSDKIFHELRFKWEPIAAGYQSREKRYGMRMRDWNALCYLAALSGHPTDAKMALEHIGNDWDPTLWQSKENFDAARNWIAGAVASQK